MTLRPNIVLSAFADEAANSKTAVEQLSVLAALGLSYYSPRFVDVLALGKVKHVTNITHRYSVMYLLSFSLIE